MMILRADFCTSASQRISVSAIAKIILEKNLKYEKKLYISNLLCNNNEIK